MKRCFNLLIILVVSLCLFACDNTSEIINLEIEIDNLRLSNTEEKVIFDIEFDNEESLGKKTIKEVSILYNFKKFNKDTLLMNNEIIKLESTNINQIEENEYGIRFDYTQYHSDLSIIILLELNDNSKMYSNLVNCNIYDLAKKEYLENEIASNIYYGFIINEIALKIDLNLYSFEGEEEKYKYTYSNPKLETITIIITLKDNYAFSKDFVLKLNDEVVKTKDYTIEDNVLTYIFEDPNWTEIY